MSCWTFPAAFCPSCRCGVSRTHVVLHGDGAWLAAIVVLVRRVQMFVLAERNGNYGEFSNVPKVRSSCIQCHRLLPEPSAACAAGLGHSRRLVQPDLHVAALSLLSECALVFYCYRRGRPGRCGHDVLHSYHLILLWRPSLASCCSAR